MSKIETEDGGARAGGLHEDAQLRLRTLHQHIGALLDLPAQPAHAEDTPGVEGPASAQRLALLAERMQQVIDTVDWPTGTRPGAAASAATEADTRPYPMPGQATATLDPDYAFGMTLDQLDEMNRLLDLLTAQGDLLMVNGDREFARGTLIVTGASIFDSADAAHAIIRKVNGQLLTEAASSAPKWQVREVRPTYGMPADADAEPRMDDRAHLH